MSKFRIKPQMIPRLREELAKRDDSTNASMLNQLFTGRDDQQHQEDTFKVLYEVDTCPDCRTIMDGLYSDGNSPSITDDPHCPTHKAALEA
jgi:hypothetical protein